MSKTPTPQQLANLKPFQKGNPGGGRPKGSVSIVKVIERMLQQEINIKNPLTQQNEKKKLVEAVATALFVKGINGDVAAIKELLDRVDGKVVQKTENTDKSHEQALRMLMGDMNEEDTKDKE